MPINGALPIGARQAGVGLSQISSRPSVIGYFSCSVLHDISRDLDPAGVAIARDLNMDGLLEGVHVDTAMAMAHDRSVDVPGNKGVSGSDVTRSAFLTGMASSRRNAMSSASPKHPFAS
jgi:hypothetical protein